MKIVRVEIFKTKYSKFFFIKSEMAKNRKMNVNIYFYFRFKMLLYNN